MFKKKCFYIKGNSQSNQINSKSNYFKLIIKSNLIYHNLIKK